MKTRRVSRVGCRVSAVALLAAVLLAGTVRATEYFVDSNRPDDGGNGLTWATAEKTIAAGVADATLPGDIVTVSNGTYNITAQIAISQAITVRSYGNGVTGGLANASTTVVSAPGWPTAVRVFNISNAGAVLDGFTAMNGYGSGQDGSGIYMGAAAVVQNCIIRNNSCNASRQPGIWMNSGGTVTNCIIRNNTSDGGSAGAGISAAGGMCVIKACQILNNSCGSGGAGGVYVVSGVAAGTLVEGCQILDNSTSGDGGGVLLADSDGTVRNCLILRNTTSGTGGGVYVSAGTIESCTIIGNSAGANGGGGIYRNGGSAGTIRNCIVYSNTSGHATYKNSYSTTTTGWTYNDTTLPDVAGTGCTNANPLVRNYAEGNYQLSVGSPCIDTGNDAAVTWGTDLAGNTRKQDIPGIGTASVDMGAYEYNTTLSCDFLASPRALIASPTTYQSFGPAPFTVQFTGWADGTNLTGLVYRWDFDNDGNYDDESGPVVSHTYNTAGVYNPRLQVTNSTEIAGKIKANYVSAGSTHYVLTSSPGAAAPYTSWATAASNSIQAAINAATLNGSVVIVSNGTYSMQATITNTKAITVRSFEGGLSGASNTVIKGKGAGSFTFRGMYINNAYAVIQGLTIRDFGVASYNHGNGIYIDTSGGLIRDCIIRDNGYNDNIHGAGIYMTAGTVSNCVVFNNQKNSSDYQGGGVYMSGSAQLLSSQILNNRLSTGRGGGVYMSGDSCLIRNCLIKGNADTSTIAGQGGGGVHMTAGMIENCTIVTNTASESGGGIYRTGGIVRNCIVYNNTAGDATYKNIYNADANVTYTCTTNPVVAGTGNIADDPRFDGDYRLRAKVPLSPCIDAGTNQAWMAGAKDLAGADRKLFGSRFGSSSAPIVDMGAYEMYVSPKGSVLVLR